MYHVIAPSIVLALSLAGIVAESAHAQVSISTVPVGNPGNPNDPETGGIYGGVDYVYRIAQTEVTLGQYAAFLNAVAADDSNHAYNLGFGLLPAVGITRAGTAGHYSYSVVGSPNAPVMDVKWTSAARFANWLSNGQPSGPQNANTTEGGAYTLNGADPFDFRVINRSPDAKWFIPSEDEWYKAAYYQPADRGGDVDGYWKYPTRSNEQPNSDQPPGEPSIATNVANGFRDDGLDNGFNDGYAVSGSTEYDSDVNYLIDVGSYVNAASFYHTFDQGGGVMEWNDTRAPLTDGRLAYPVRGGDWLTSSENMRSSLRGQLGTWERYVNVGFRVATIIPAYPGDATWDDVVDGADYTVWADHFLQTGQTWTSGDFNGDGFVDGADYTIWADHFAPAQMSLSSVPEPSTLALAGISVLALLAHGIWHRMSTRS